MASSSSAAIPKARRYDVFLSFRGEDIRNDFRSHLYDALCRNQILTFIDDNLRRGDNISSLFTAIEESMISVIIFSENYADSKWCLKELAKILQCRKLNDQIVIPVFYGVDPSDIKKQTGKFGLAFDKLKERLLEGEIDLDLDEVRSHLKEAANISGWNSQIISSESQLIKAIVGDILNKMNRVTLNLPSNLVGIGSHIEQVETLLRLDSTEFRTVGLWGMGGIGKTTIARAVFNRIYNRFDGFHFVENVSEELTNQSVDALREKILLKLFEEEKLSMGNRTLRHDFVMNQLQRKKVLVVLDNVDDVLKAKNLFESISLCGGSRILVTSRDRQLLKNIGAEIYEVEGLNKEDGVQLFSLGAFKQNHPTSDRLELSRRVLSYARGNPLALIVLGCALFDKSKEEWDSALDGLGEEPFPDIQKVLRISYDALCDQEKTIFLDIASFLIGKTEDFVVAYYKESVIGIKYKISNLVDKSLVTISENKKLGMHDLLKEMGRSIESAKRPEERKRIWNFKDLTQISKERKESSRIEAIKVNICSVFARLWDFKDVIGVSKKREGSSLIEAISVNLCQGERISREFDCRVLARLDCLRFLEFHQDANEESKVRFCWKGFRGFPEELRYFSWDAYPQKSLGSIFCPENLVELHMEDSAIRKLWAGKQNIVNLKVINLKDAHKLVEFPDVSEGRNIERINLYGCQSLVKLPLSIQHLPKLEFLDLTYCSSVKRVPTTFDSEVLEDIGLSYCRGVKMFPLLASANIITKLDLEGTCIKEVPSSVELLRGLEKLSMFRCKKLSIISTNICKLKSLSELNLSNCTNLESFPEIMEPMESLWRLDLSGCTRLERLPNDDHSIHNLKSLRELYLDDTAITELPSSIQYLICLQRLHLSGCQNLTSLELGGCTRLKRLPNDHSFHNLKSLEELHLDDTAITELPSSIQHLICLKKLKISGCQNLTSLPSFIHNHRMLELDLEGCSNLCSLPELPSSLETLKANRCISLKTISSACFPSESRITSLEFGSCFELDEEERRRVLDSAFSIFQSYLYRQRLYFVRYYLMAITTYQKFRIALPWSSEIPQLFCGSQSVGSSLTLKLPPMDVRRYIFAFCVVIKKPNYGPNHMFCHVDDNDAWVTYRQFNLEPSVTEHLLLWYDGDFKLTEYFGREVSLQFREKEGNVEVTKCGVLILSV